MRIEDIKRGDFVYIRAGTNPHLIGQKFWGRLVQVAFFNIHNNTITFRDPSDDSPLWWPVKDCDPYVETRKEQPTLENQPEAKISFRESYDLVPKTRFNLLEIE